jgi:CMP-N,N'-diacetyllegionaminic acid synthase
VIKLCTICARGGSKGVKNKNIKPINGLPLNAYSIIQAKESGLFDAIAVSSDSQDILDAAKKFGADYCIKRPESLANDTAGKVPAIRHCMLEVEKILNTQVEVLVDLDATSPLRSLEDISDSLKEFESKNASNLLTVTPSRRSPYFNMVEMTEDNKVALVKSRPESVIRRQDTPVTFDMNASIYIWKREVLVEQNLLFLNDTTLFQMPESRSYDVDSMLDFEIVQMIIKNESERFAYVQKYI